MDFLRRTCRRKEKPLKMEGEHPSLAAFQSICHVRASELFPKQQLTREDASIQVPFTPLCGESVGALGRTTDGILAVSNYRLFVEMDDGGFYNIPLGCIESLECRDLISFHVLGKDGRSLRCLFVTSERCQEWMKRITGAIAIPPQIEGHFAFAFHAWASEEESSDLLNSFSFRQKPANFMDEVKRLQFNLEGPWRITDVNSDYLLCPTYPPRLIVPAKVTDGELQAVAKFRISRRLPVVVWRYPETGAVIMRSSQPERGLLNWRSEHDENYINAVRDACAVDAPASLKTPKKNLLIMDARSFSTATANRLRGGGVECNAYYQDCDIEFLSLPNIHAVRKSFHALRALYGTADNASWWQVVDSTKWLNYLAAVLSASARAASAVKSAQPLLVHCSDGWDRTPQIVSTAQILLDPYYRTVEGFRVLVQREWLDFGHKFGDRCGNSMGSDCEDVSERCPVFLQWLDCVHQLLVQFPCSFQFSELLLVKLVQHTYSHLFGTFLGNSPRERAAMKITERTFSVWPLLLDPQYLNLLYVGTNDPLVPSCNVRDMLLWNDVFLCDPERIQQPKAELKPRKDKFPMPKLVGPRKYARKMTMSPVIGERETDVIIENDRSCAPQDQESDISIIPEPSVNGEAGDAGDVLPGDETEPSQDFLPPRSSPRSIRLRPARKNRTISEELYENFMDPLDRSVNDHDNVSELADNSQESSTSSGTLVNFPTNGASYGQTPGMGEDCVYRRPNFGVDGLVTDMKPMQVQVRALIAEHRARVSALERDLQEIRLRMVHNQWPTERSNSISICESEGNSVHSHASEQSWEAVEERDTATTLWVPDHAASTCAACNTPFWIGRRKHHCRRCGNVFCSDCSDHTAILPSQDLYYPVRVCDSCHSQIDSSCQLPQPKAQQPNTQPTNVFQQPDCTHRTVSVTDCEVKNIKKNEDNLENNHIPPVDENQVCDNGEQIENNIVASAGCNGGSELPDVRSNELSGVNKSSELPHLGNGFTPRKPIENSDSQIDETGP